MNLFLVEDRTTLYNLADGNLRPVNAKNVFGDRIDAGIRGGKTVLLTLQKLNYSDSNSFELQVLLLRDGQGSLTQSAVIKLNVEGMEHVIICSSCS